MDDNDVLLEIAQAVGLDPTRTLEILNSREFEEGVKYDIYEAQSIGCERSSVFCFQ